MGIAEHANNIFGEIDFVILCNEGVLCLEVKGGQVSRRKGVWEFTNRYGKISRKNEGPLQQVQGDMQSLRQYMVRRLGNYDPLVRYQYVCAVAMPDCRFGATGVGIDVVPEILVDAKQPWNLDSLVDQAFGYWRQSCIEKHGFEGGRLTDAENDKMANLLRGDFHFVPSMKDTVERTVKELCALTAEQYEVLESLFENPRTMVSGVAGAGKTLIAMEQARRAYWEGKSVLYLCYNHNIAQYVQYQFEKDRVYIEAVTLHAFMMRTCGVEWSPDLSQHFYEKELPATFMAAEDGVTAGGGKLTFKGLSNSSTKVTDGTNRYWLVETKTVNGYNLLAKPVKVELSIAYKTSWSENKEYHDGVLVKHELTEKKEKFERNEGTEMNDGTQNGEKGTGSKSIVVVNKKGFQLPVTGGFGTLLFSGIGVLLVLAGVAVLFSMKKKNDRA